MAQGIDLYRYQTVTNWGAVKNAGVTFVYVKATDGGGLAPVHADSQVNGAKSVQIPVGVYHFSQPGDPQQQANILLGEVRRLGATGLGPALDLEDNPAGTGKPNIPDSQKAAWAQAFLRVIAGAGFRPVVYMSSALAKLLRPDLWGIPNLVIWIASYGPNNGQRNALTGGYPGRVDIHQYTSTGRVAGVSGAVDLNESLTPITPQEDDMLADERAWLLALFNAFYSSKDAPYEVTVPDRLKEIAGQTTMVANQFDSTADAFYEITVPDRLKEISAKAGGQVDPAAIAEALTAAVGAMSDEALARFAAAVQDEADRRALARLAPPQAP